MSRIIYTLYTDGTTKRQEFFDHTQAREVAIRKSNKSDVEATEHDGTIYVDGREDRLYQPPPSEEWSASHE